MSRRSKQILFFVAYVIVLMQLFEVFLATVGLVSLGAPALVRIAWVLSLLLMGLALAIVMILRPMLEREFIIDRPRTENRELRTEN